MVAFVAAGMIASWACARLNLALPAVAIDERGEVLDRTWSRGRGNTTRIFLGILLVTGPIWLLDSLLRRATSFGSLPLLGLTYGLLSNLVDTYLATALYVSFLSFAFKRLVAHENRA